MFSLSENALRVEAIDLWIDSMRARERCYVSHGHSDHARAHAAVVATPATASVCRVRFSRRVEFEERGYNQAWYEGEHRLTLFPAGHVLGSSQLLVEGEAGRFVYTGDFNLARSFTAEPAEVKRCDVVLMECTFGRPHYVFPPRDEIAGEIARFARLALEADAVPVFFAYSLGKAQEAMAILGSAGIPIAVHSAIAAMAEAYVRCGIALPEYTRYQPASFHGNQALIWPPSAKALPRFFGRRRTRTAALTGWAIDGSAHRRHGVDRAFPLSDHADYPGLLAYVERAQPRKVLLNHGRRDFVHRLRGLGVEAEFLERHAQLALF